MDKRKMKHMSPIIFKHNQLECNLTFCSLSLCILLFLMRAIHSPLEITIKRSAAFIQERSAFLKAFFLKESMVIGSVSL